MIKSDTQNDLMAGLGSAIEAFERGLDEYQTQLLAWSQNRRRSGAHETAMMEERAAAKVCELEEQTQQLALDQKALAQSKAELEAFKAKLDAQSAEWGRRERALIEREGSLGQKCSSHQQIADALEERTRQFIQRERELEGKYGKSSRELDVRKAAMAISEKKLAEQRKRFENDQLELTRFREEFAQRESELAAQSAANRETQKKLATLSCELDAKQKALSGDVDGIASRLGQIDRRTEELSSLQSQLQAQKAETDARTLALDADAQQLKKQSDVLLHRERELEQRTAQSTTEYEKAAHDLERREREFTEATRALSARSVGLETGRREIEARQLAFQETTQAHQQREKELAETQRKTADRQTALDEADGRLRTAHQALQAERNELATARKSAEAEMAAAREKAACAEAELLARRDQVVRNQKALEHQAQLAERQKEEIERRSKALAEREGELNGQRAQLEADFQNLRNEQVAIEKAQRVVTEVDESRWDELKKVRAELNALRAENELGRVHERELEGSLGQVQAASAREMHAAEDARRDAARLAEQLELEKRIASEQRSEIERREHEILAMLEDGKSKSVDATANPPDGGTLLVQRQASHVAVAAFWADFNPSLSLDGTAADVFPQAKSVVAGTSTTESNTTAPRNGGAPDDATEEPVDTQASAMREALAAARAEVEAAKHQKSTAAQKSPKEKAPPNGRKRKTGNAPVKFTQDMAQTSAAEPLATQAAPVLASIDLDPETAKKLRMLRRLNPSKSDQELLVKIAAEEKTQGKAKQKKSWFALK